MASNAQSTEDDPYKLAKEVYSGGTTVALMLYVSDGPQPGLGDAAGVIYQTSTIVTAGLIFAGIFIYHQFNNPVFGDSNSWTTGTEKPFMENTKFDNENPFNEGGSNIPEWLRWFMAGVGGFSGGYELYQNTRPEEITPIPSPAPTIIYPTADPIYGY